MTLPAIPCACHSRHQRCTSLNGGGGGDCEDDVDCVLGCGVEKSEAISSSSVGCANTRAGCRVAKYLSRAGSVSVATVAPRPQVAIPSGGSAIFSCHTTFGWGAKIDMRARKRSRAADDDNGDCCGPDWLEHSSLQSLDLSAADAAIAQVEAARKKKEEDDALKRYEARPLPSFRRARKQLGKVSKNSVCFFCNYIGERDTALDYGDVSMLIETLRNNLGAMDSVPLAQLLAKRYEELRARRNRHLGLSEAPLPPMDAAMVLEHIDYHTEDAETVHLQMCKKTKEIRLQMERSLFERNATTKHTRADKGQVDAYVKLINTETALRSKDPSKWAYYSQGARLNPNVHKQGPVSTNCKTVVDMWRTRGGGGGSGASGGGGSGNGGHQL